MIISILLQFTFWISREHESHISGCQWGNQCNLKHLFSLKRNNTFKKYRRLVRYFDLRHLKPVKTYEDFCCLIFNGLVQKGLRRELKIELRVITESKKVEFSIMKQIFLMTYSSDSNNNHEIDSRSLLPSNHVQHIRYTVYLILYTIQ